MLNAPKILKGVEALLSVVYSFPPTVAVHVGNMALKEAERSTLSFMNAIAAGLKNWLSAPSFIPIPACPMPSCRVLREFT